MAALKFLYTKTMWKPEAVSFMSWPSDPQKLPTVLAADEVERLLGALERPKYRVFFTTVYATGLRVSEACKLETRDIDAARGVILVRHAKRQKERFVMLSPRLLAILRAYWSLERPPAPWLFASSKGSRHLTTDSARKALKLAVAKEGLTKHRVGIANSRLVDVTGDAVTFRTKNGKSITVTPVEFLRRFVQHVLPDGFHKIRHYGLYAGAAAHARLVASHLLAPTAPSATTTTSAWDEHLREITGRDVHHCPHCGDALEHRPVPTPLGRAPPRAMDIAA